MSLTVEEVEYKVDIINMKKRSMKMEISKEAMEIYLQMCLDDMSDIDKAAMGVLMKQLSGSEQSDEDYLRENFPEVEIEAVRQFLREYSEYKLQQE